MKSFLVIISIISVCSAGLVVPPARSAEDGDRYFYFAADGASELEVVDSQDPVDEEYIAQYVRNPANNQYWLFTRANPSDPQTLVLEDDDSVRLSNFDPRRATVVLAHGWNGHGGNEMNQLLTEAFLHDADVNVLVVDWSRLANRGYTTAKAGVAEVGRGLGRLLQWLTHHGLEYEHTHLVGFSLGAHLVGNAARETGSLIGRITGLDPAGPLWGSDRNRLSSSDAAYVEVIHTSSVLGFTDPLGHADFYPNGGTSMPGCWVSSCSHSRAYMYMASSVKNRHLKAKECGSYRDASRDRCDGDLYPMGNSDMDKNGSGIFRVNTGRNYPY
ncbi:lipase member H-A isoform X2 [Plutella xylostella]|uniref:lipase member H-A isoform X2 n=1 Tax=Plutella xylostella TaxID=51655 RepID=UPI0020326E82|nr:lipase member H-A isoform X2 [Plutella xylostella]